MATKQHTSTKARRKAAGTGSVSSPSPDVLALARRLQDRIGRVKALIALELINEQVAEDKPDISDARVINAARTASLRARILEDSLNSDDVRSFISRTRPVVVKMAHEGKLLAVEDGRALRFPRWQFDENSNDGLVRGLQDILAVMDASGFRKAAWFITDNPALCNRRPLDALREGNIREVSIAAQSLVDA